MNREIQSGIINLPSNFQITIINRVKIIINEIINESLNIALSMMIHHQMILSKFLKRI